jgi:hypothetical protein
VDSEGGPYIRRSLGNGRGAGPGDGPGEVDLKASVFGFAKRLKSLVDKEIGIP